jgi:hypothetical protein
MISERIFLHDYRPSALLKVSGNDAFSFMQGQFSNELRQGNQLATYGLWLNQKGRVVADSQVLALGANEFYLLSTASPAATIQQRLEAYIVADEVTVTDETATVGGLVIGGSACGEMIMAMAGNIPAAGKYVRAGLVLILLGRRIREENYEIIGPVEALAEWREKLIAQGGLAVGPGQMELARIEAGLPAIPPDLGLGDLPNEGGLEETAISYTKGCYLGQEVMARLKNLGQVRRRLHRISGPGGPPAPAQPLYHGAKKIGEIRSATEDGPRFGALAMLTLAGVAGSPGLSLTPDGPADIRIHSNE